MISSFGDKVTQALFDGFPRRLTLKIPRDVAIAAVRKLDALNAAVDLKDLRAPPGNRLEALHGDLDGCFSVRVNDQWRIVFRWKAGRASDVTLVDYHC
jgi:proteic killer suppression protein